MSKSIIKVENLSKSYLIGHQTKEKYTALRDVISNSAKGFFKNASKMLHGEQLMGNDNVEEFFALKDINFEINQGDRVGIIGRNGAGKSTLLKVLSRITEPTSGRVTINGRVASLLEVGTGFHPELSGRENIYLNGAILGMSRSEVKQKFDEIVEFAEVEKFLDTPVKRYSSGMYVRLAFAVAAHLEPEILIVDEVLAVGDAQFQKKCLGKMNEVSRNGRTVLFVSHNMSAVRNLCSKGILLQNGKVLEEGDVQDIINKYEQVFTKNKTSLTDQYKRNFIEIKSFNLKLKDGSYSNHFSSGDDIEFRIIFKSCIGFLNDLSLGIAFEDNQGNLTLINYSDYYDIFYSGEEFNITVNFNKIPISHGDFQIHFRVTQGMRELFWSKGISSITIGAGDYFGTGKRGDYLLCKNYHDLNWKK